MVQNNHGDARPSRPKSWAAVLLALWVVLPWAWNLAAADPLDGPLEIQSAFVDTVGGVYRLHVRTRYPANEQTVAALREGITLTYTLETTVSRPRPFWLDAEVVALQLERELSFQPVSERYVILDPLADGEQRSFVSLDEALVALGEIDAWPILVAAQTREPGEYRVSVRATIRRGRLTDALRALMFWSDDWQRASEWYSWSLPR